MYKKLIPLMILLSVVTLQGCETFKGLKKDTKTVWDGVVHQDKDSWVTKTDVWMEEHLW